jgi:hypothetical protein
MGFRTVLMMLSVALVAQTTHADSGVNANQNRRLRAVETAAPTPSPDPRLPPVLPGEEVGQGENRMKVWSTGGSPSHEAPPAPDETDGEPNVIIHRLRR